MYISLQTKILLAILTIVSLFAFFTLIYFPAQQRRYLLSSYNNEVQNLSNTVALGVRIALNEENYEGVQTAMEFVKGNPNFRFVSLLETDTTWNAAHTTFQTKDHVFKTFPDSVTVDPAVHSSDSLIVKRTPFHTGSNAGAILLGFSTDEINKSQAEIFKTSLLISSLIFIIGLLIGVFISRNLSAPVIALRNASRRIEQGDLTPVVWQFSNDEIGDLAAAFNSMVKELSHSREDLHTVNRELSKTNATLSATLDNLKSAQQQLIQAEKMASLGELTAGIAHEIQNPLNFVNNFSDVNAELLDELEQAWDKGDLASMKELIADLKTNFQKINHHGRRADAIVKGMLQHSRSSTGTKEPVDINSLVEEYIRLSYHGLRAKDSSFSATFQTDFDKRMGRIPIVPQDIGRVILNLLNNAFYAVNEQKKQKIENYQPVVTVTTKRMANLFTLTVSDNGIGIPQAVLDKIFQPFFTTKPTGEGTGLGLSLSYDIVTNGHGGQLRVETTEGEGSTFIVQLPIDH